MRVCAEMGVQLKPDPQRNPLSTSKTPHDTLESKVLEAFNEARAAMQMTQTASPQGPCVLCVVLCIVCCVLKCLAAVMPCCCDLMSLFVAAEVQNLVLQGTQQYHDWHVWAILAYWHRDSVELAASPDS